MLALKLVLVPTFLALLTLAARRWGAAVAGRLAGLPVVTGPILFVIALEQGAHFTAGVATSALAAVGAAAAFSLTYSWACLRWSWGRSLLASAASWFVVALGASFLPHDAGVSLVVAVAGLAVALALLPPVTPGTVGGAQFRGRELVLRMVAGATLTVVVSGAAATIGSIWTGLFAVFPVMGTVLAVFSHRAHGAAFVTPLLRGMILGMYATAAFCVVLATLLDRLGVAGAFAIGVVAALGAQALVWKALEVRARRTVARAVPP
ncbi:MAG: hypothetical protein GC151_11255 [Betaproteobacteria bacterium]|nr:hypothetical protein [Betaproteobacteria bacterium]